MTHKKCIVCGTEFYRGNFAKYCKKCSAVKGKERAKMNRYRSKHGLTRAIGSTDNCLLCEESYIVANGAQKYCPTCSHKLFKCGLYYRMRRDKTRLELFSSQDN